MSYQLAIMKAGFMRTSYPTEVIMKYGPQKVKGECKISLALGVI